MSKRSRRETRKRNRRAGRLAAMDRIARNLYVARTEGWHSYNGQPRIIGDPATRAWKRREITDQQKIDCYWLRDLYDSMHGSGAGGVWEQILSGARGEGTGHAVLVAAERVANSRDLWVRVTSQITDALERDCVIGFAVHGEDLTTQVERWAEMGQAVGRGTLSARLRSGLADLRRAIGSIAA